MGGTMQDVSSHRALIYNVIRSQVHTLHGQTGGLIHQVLYLKDLENTYDNDYVKKPWLAWTTCFGRCYSNACSNISQINNTNLEGQ